MSLVLGLAANGCGDDTLPEGSPGKTGDASVPPTKLPPDQESCLAKHTQDASVSDVDRCRCKSCLKQTSACDDDPGCSEIRACMDRTGCSDMNECYFERAPCRSAIERWGIMSLALSLAQELAECSIESECVTIKEPECSVVGELRCDGNEDCPKGRICCGHFNGLTYDGASCAESCDAADRPDAGPTEQWAQLCHPGDECGRDGERCLSYDLLPPFLNRCEDTGSAPVATGSRAAKEINCGGKICRAAEKCCLRTPKQPYCAPVDEPCACSLPGDKDAGPPDDAGAEDGGS